MNEDLLSAYADDELDGRQRAEVEQELARSAELRAVLDEVRQVRDAVRALPERDAPSGFWDGMLGTEGVVDLADERHRRRGGRPARWAALAAAAAAAAIVGVAMVPGEDPVRPAVATLTDAHAVRSSVGNDAVATLAGSAVSKGLGP